MVDLKDMEMPELEGPENEELDLFEEETVEGEGGSLEGFSDDELIEELKARGFDIEEEGGEEPAEEPVEEEPVEELV